MKIEFIIFLFVIVLNFYVSFDIVLLFKNHFIDFVKECKKNGLIDDFFDFLVKNFSLLKKIIFNSEIKANIANNDQGEKDVCNTNNTQGEQQNIIKDKTELSLKEKIAKKESSKRNVSKTENLLSERDALSYGYIVEKSNFNNFK